MVGPAGAAGSVWAQPPPVPALSPKNQYDKVPAWALLSIEQISLSSLVLVNHARDPGMGCNPLHDLMSKGYRLYNFYRLYGFCSIPPRELADNLKFAIAPGGTHTHECVHAPSVVPDPQTLRQ